MSSQYQNPWMISNTFNHIKLEKIVFLVYHLSLVYIYTLSLVLSPCTYHLFIFTHIHLSYHPVPITCLYLHTFTCPITLYLSLFIFTHIHLSYHPVPITCLYLHTFTCPITLTGDFWVKDR